MSVRRASFVVAGLISFALVSGGARGQGPARGRPGGEPPVFPLLRALDADGDGEGSGEGDRKLSDGTEITRR